MKNIVLIGFMGTGKTSTGRLLAGKMGYSFVDTDYKIEQTEKITIPEMFAQYGEAYFRGKEAEMIRRVSRYRQAVIATGGGAVLNPDNMRNLKKSGLIVALHAPVDVILERTGRRHARPLLEQEDRRQTVVTLLAQRRSLYEKADFNVDTGSFTPLQVVEKIMDWLRRIGELRA